MTCKKAGGFGEPILSGLGTVEWAEFSGKEVGREASASLEASGKAAGTSALPVGDIRASF